MHQINDVQVILHVQVPEENFKLLSVSHYHKCCAQIDKFHVCYITKNVLMKLLDRCNHQVQEFR